MRDLLIGEAVLGVAVLVASGIVGVWGLSSFRRVFGPWAATGLLAALGIFWTISVFLPFPHGNELVNWQSSLVGTWTGSDLVGYPHPTLYFNLSTSLYGLVAFLGWVTGGGDPALVLAETVLVRSGLLLSLSRLLSATAWIGVAALTARIALEIHGERRAALLAGLLILPLHHRESTAFSPYALAVLLATGSAWAIWRHRSVLVGGSLLGAAVATHYFSMLAAPALFLRRRNGRSLPLREVVLWFAAASIAFLLLNPQAFLFPAETFTTLIHRVEEAKTFLAVDESSGRPGWGPLYYLVMLVQMPIGWLATLGAVVAFRNRHGSPRPWRLASAVLAGIGVLSLPATRFDRYLMFLYPMLVPLAAGAWPSPEASTLRRGLAGLLVLASLVQGSLASWYFRGSSAVLHPPFSEMAAWARTNTAPGDRIVLRLPWAGDMRRALEETRPARVRPEIVTAVESTLLRVTGVPVHWEESFAASPLPDETGRTWLYEVEWQRSQDGPRDRPEGAGTWWAGGVRHRVRLYEEAKRESGKEAPGRIRPGRNPPPPPVSE